MAAPSQEQRKKCWDARDGYWACLEENNEDKTKCDKARKPMDAHCLKTWVKYFDRRRDFLKYKEELQKIPEKKKT